MTPGKAPVLSVLSAAEPEDHIIVLFKGFVQNTLGVCRGKICLDARGFQADLDMFTCSGCIHCLVMTVACVCVCVCAEDQLVADQVMNN